MSQVGPDPYAPFMLEAIRRARRGIGRVEPNPRVGAVALEGGKYVGFGHHAEWGGPHAEVAALDAARAGRARPDTVVVTLEPCSSRGGEKKQPPCTDALIEAGVETVVVGALDPDPRHAGRGIDVLREAGIHVVEGVCEAECRELNPAFERWLGLDRPWVIAKWAMSLDGKIATAAGDSKWISNESSRRHAHRLRARVDAVIVGFRTAERDDPELTVRHVEGADPIRVVVDPRCEIKPSWKLASTAHRTPTWVLTSPDVATDGQQALEALGVTVIPVPERSATRLDMREALRELRRRGVRVVLVEGGGSLLAQMFGQGCVDQVEAFVAPHLLIGGATAPTPFDGEGFDEVARALRLDETYFGGADGDLLIGGIFHGPADHSGRS